VRVTSAVEDTLQETMHFTVEVLADVVVDVAPLESGTLLTLQVDQGDTVEAGEVLGQLDAHLQRDRIAELSAQRDTADQRLSLAVADAERASAEVDRRRPLLSAGAFTTAEFQRLEDDVAVLQAAVNVADTERQELRALTQTARTNLQRREITSPVSGLVVERLLSAGATVSSSTPILRVIAPDSLQVVAQLPERLIPILSDGVQAAIRLDALPEQEMSGRLIRVGDIVQREARTVETRFEFLAPVDGLRHGMFGRGELVIESVDGIVLPQNTLVERVEGDTIVWVVENDQVSARPVQVLLRSNHQVAVSGVEEGEEVIVGPPAGLTDGSQVYVVRRDGGAS
jgi:RND family efflux transporter MFP subunit